MAISAFEDYADDDMEVMVEWDEETSALHPLVQQMLKGDVIISVDSISQFEDDHLTCYTLRIKTLNGGDYVIGVWHQTFSGLARWIRAEGNAEKSLALAKEIESDFDADAREYMGLTSPQE